MTITKYYTDITRRDDFYTDIDMEFYLSSNPLVTKEHDINCLMQFLKYSLYYHYKRFYDSLMAKILLLLNDIKATTYKLHISIPYQATGQPQVILKPI